VTLPSSAMKETDAITTASLFASPPGTTPGNRTFEQPRPFERLAHSNDVPVRMAVRVRMISVSRGRRILPYFWSTARCKSTNCRHADILCNCRRVDIHRSNGAACSRTHSPALVARPSTTAMFCISS
jgi:hypothetical protein